MGRKLRNPSLFFSDIDGWSNKIVFKILSAFSFASDLFLFFFSYSLFEKRKDGKRNVFRPKKKTKTKKKS